MNRDIIAFTKYKFNVYGKKDIRSGRDSAVVGIVGKSKSLDFPTMLIFWSLVRNSVVLAVYLLFSVACFLTVHEHYDSELNTDMILIMYHRGGAELAKSFLQTAKAYMSEEQIASVQQLWERT